MGVKHDFALVPKQPNSLETASPGARRILSGMIADTLMLAKTNPSAKTALSVVIGGFSGIRWPVLFKAIIESQWGDQFDVKITSETNAMNLLTSVGQALVDLFILHVDKDADCSSIGELLVGLKARYGKPIIVWGTHWWQTVDCELPGADAYLEGSNWIQSLLNALATYLRTPANSSMVAKTHSPWRSWSRPPRIVMMDDLRSVLEMLESVIRIWFPDATILTFTDAELAYQELMREDPDLFTTDVCHPEPDGDELLRLLTARNVKYPIFVMSAWVKTKEALRPGCIGPNLNVTLMPKPFPLDELYWQLLSNVGLSDWVQRQSPQIGNDQS